MPKRDEIKWIDLPGLTGAYSAAGFRSKQYATYVVAAVDSTPDERAAADYVCDGVADEVEINNALSAKGGLTRVLLLSGHFYIQSTINMVAGAVLEGQGSATVLSVSVTFSTSGEVIIGSDHIQLKNFVIDGSSRAHINTIRLDTFEDVLVDGVAFQNMNHWRGFSIYGDGSNDIRIVNCRVDGSNASQAFIDQYAATGAEFRRLTVQGCHFAGMTGPVTILVYGDEEPSTGKLPLPSDMTTRQVNVTGNTFEGDGTCTFFSAVSCSLLNVTGNTINNCNNGVQFQDCFDVTVSGNVVTTCNEGVTAQNSYYADDRGGSQLYAITGNTIRQADQCIAIVGPPNSDGEGTRETEDYRTFATVAGNTLVDAASGNITLGTCARVVVTGNTIIQTAEFAGTGTTGIEIVDSWDLVINGNQITETVRGVWASNSQYILIGGNHISQSQLDGILIDGCVDTVIRGNYFLNSGANPPGSGRTYFAHITVDTLGGNPAVERLTIEDNTFRGSQDTTLLFLDDATEVLIRNNDFYYGSTRVNGTFSSTPIIVVTDTIGVATGETVTGEIRNNRVSDEVSSFKIQDVIRAGSVESAGIENTGAVVTGNITVKGNSSWIRVTANPLNDPNDNLLTITGLQANCIYILSPTTGDTITVKATNFKLDGSADFAMNSVYDRMMIHYDGTNVVELSRSNNG